MLKFVIKISYSTIICNLLSGCYHFGNTSLYVRNSSTQQLINKIDKIAIVASRPDLENFWTFKAIKIRAQSYFQERGYTVVEKTSPDKPNVFALLEPRVKTETHQETHQVCTEQVIDPFKSSTDPSNTYTTCHDETYTVYTYIYNYNLTIYRPESVCSDINQCKHNTIFSSQIHYETQKNIDDNEMFLMMTDAIFATFPLQQNSLVYFQRTPDGYIPTQITKKN